MPQELLVRAFAQRSAAFQASVICGPALGGLLFAIHPELVYGVAAGFSVIALIAILALRAGREGVGSGSPDLASVLGGVRRRCAVGETHPPVSLPRLTGADYTTVLRWLHETLRPQTYLEIGTLLGDTRASLKSETGSTELVFLADPDGTRVELMKLEG